jgi:hypothetical protein
MMRELTAREMHSQRNAYYARVAPIAEERLSRMRHGQKHPVRDFLFEYYAFRPAKLLRWSPGPNVQLTAIAPGETDWPDDFQQTPAGALLPADSFPIQRRDYLTWAIDYLSQVSERPAYNHCYGMHEWAMVYRTEEIRHASTPLRLSTAEIASVVESVGLRCTHYDAYRFFTPAALPRNRLALTRVTTTEHDQPGCVHVAMDLYKFAMKIQPWIDSDIIADALELAVQARELDMRASPYDLRALGYEPIALETQAGREDYRALQHDLSARAAPVRARLSAAYRLLVG